MHLPDSVIEELNLPCCRIRDGLVIRANPAFAALVQAGSSQALEGLIVAQALFREAQIQPLLREADARGASSGRPIECNTLAGRRRIVHAHALRRAQGTNASENTTYDLTAEPVENQAADEREDRDRLLREMGENLPLVIWLRTPGQVIYVNSEYERLFGRPRHNLYADPTDHLEAVHPDDRDWVERSWSAQLQHGGHYQAEYRIVQPNGETVWIREHERAVPAEAPAQAIRYVGFAEDVTEQRRGHDALAQANKLKGEFLAAVSHDLRTPLNAVIGFTDLLERTSLNAEQARYAQRVRRGSEKLLQLIDLLLELAQIDAGALTLHPEPFELDDLLLRQIELVEPIATRRGLQLSHRVDPGLPTHLLGDRSRLAQVLGNLIDNAVKFTQEGEVGIYADPLADGWVRFRVLDTGPGIDESERESIFESFSRGLSSEARHPGKGLGLKICLELVRLMGGAIDVENRPEGGACFQVVVPLPAAEPPAPDPQAGTHGEGSAASDSAGERRPLRALLVEDNPTNVLLLDALLRQCECIVEIVHDGQAATQCATDESFDLIVMDVQLPDIPGDEAVRRIREVERTNRNACRTPIVALSAHALDEVRQRMIDAGCDDYLTKPVALDDLHKTVRKHAKARATQSGG